MKNIVLAITSLILLSCNNSEKKGDHLEKKNDYLENGVELQKGESEVAKPNFDAALNVKINLIHCQNEKFVIRIDRMNDENLRYLTWNKPKNETTEPELILSNGKIEKQGTMGGYIYTFENEEWNYIVEDNQMGETDESMGIFLKLVKNGTEMLYTKMQQIK